MLHKPFASCCASSALSVITVAIGKGEKCQTAIGCHLKHQQHLLFFFTHSRTFQIEKLCGEATSSSRTMYASQQRIGSWWQTSFAPFIAKNLLECWSTLTLNYSLVITKFLFAISAEPELHQKCITGNVNLKCLRYNHCFATSGFIRTRLHCTK